MSFYDLKDDCDSCGTYAKFVKVPRSEDPSGSLHECLKCGTTKSICVEPEWEYPED